MYIARNAYLPTTVHIYVTERSLYYYGKRLTGMQMRRRQAMSALKHSDCYPVTHQKSPCVAGGGWWTDLPQRPPRVLICRLPTRTVRTARRRPAPPHLIKCRLTTRGRAWSSARCAVLTPATKAPLRQTMLQTMLKR